VHISMSHFVTLYGIMELMMSEAVHLNEYYCSSSMAVDADCIFEEANPRDAAVAFARRNDHNIDYVDREDEVVYVRRVDNPTVMFGVLVKKELHIDYYTVEHKLPGEDDD